jgi:hypothetical protein
MTTKILALTDALGNLVRRASAGTALRHRGRAAAHRGLAFDALIADKAFDSNAIIADLEARGAKAASPSIRAAQSNSPSTRGCTNGGISSRIFLARFSRSSNASPCAPTRPIRASPP